MKTPPSGAVNFAFDVGGGGLVGSEVASVAFMAVDLKIKFLAGGRFPGVEGGSWSGLAFEPTAAMLAVFQSSPSSGYSSSESKSTIGVQLGATLGYQYLSFGKMNETTLKQSGFGLLLGAYLGGTGISIPDEYGESKMNWSLSYGPVLGLSFPRYNAGTARYQAFSITGMVLPTGDATLISASLGYQF
ncbi:MAG TPA: hypothetical protein VM580_01760 [Labilithrix sp.]|nr:hypothetical protein [Labilithrix sp.]